MRQLIHLMHLTFQLHLQQKRYRRSQLQEVYPFCWKVLGTEQSWTCKMLDKHWSKSCSLHCSKLTAMQTFPTTWLPPLLLLIHQVVYSWRQDFPKCSFSTSDPFSRTLSQIVHDCQLLPHSGLSEHFIQRTWVPTVPQFCFLVDWNLITLQYQVYSKDGTCLKFLSFTLIPRRCFPSCQSLVTWADLLQ